MVAAHRTGTPGIGDSAPFAVDGGHSGGQGSGFFRQSPVAGSENGRNAQFHGAKRDGAIFADGKIVDPLVGHADIAGVRQMRIIRTGLGVLSDDCQRIISGIKPPGPDRIGMAAHQQYPAVQKFTVDAVVVMPDLDMDFVSSGIEESGGDGIDFHGQQFAAVLIMDACIGAIIVEIEHPGDAFHISHDENFHSNVRSVQRMNTRV
ncbi:hypothetical protein SDC9_160302 [bioreactor metagenome]|uniref:Uncharacterized protein n=1 Tax=bioreactor metagenome TaxID=1076179 RepID=A0A645FHI6_9ZZZZ